jgi:hypothetical protein
MPHGCGTCGGTGSEATMGDAKPLTDEELTHWRRYLSDTTTDSRGCDEERRYLATIDALRVERTKDAADYFALRVERDEVRAKLAAAEARATAEHERYLDRARRWLDCEARAERLERLAMHLIALTARPGHPPAETLAGMLAALDAAGRGAEEKP